MVRKQKGCLHFTRNSKLNFRNYGKQNFKKLTQNVKTSGMFSLIADETSGMFSLIADETADIANTEQLVICLRWADKNLENHEEFVRVYPLSSANVEDIFFNTYECFITFRAKCF